MAAATLLIGLAYAYWRHGTLMALQLMGLIIFFYTGRSDVTQSRMQIHVCQDKI